MQLQRVLEALWGLKVNDGNPRDVWGVGVRVFLVEVWNVDPHKSAAISKMTPDILRCNT